MILGQDARRSMGATIARMSPRPSVVALLLAVLAWFPGPAQARSNEELVFDCSDEGGKDQFKGFLIGLKKEKPKDFERLKKEKLGLDGKTHDRRRCLLAQWCLHQSATVEFGKKSSKALSAPARSCEEPFYGDCESSTACVWETAPLGKGKDPALARVLLDARTVTISGKAPIWEKSSGNAGDFAGAAFVVKDGAYKVQPETNLVFQRLPDGGRLVFTGAEVDRRVTWKLYDALGKDPVMETKGCAEIGLAQDANGDYLDARGNRWRSMRGTCRGLNPAPQPLP